MRKYKNLPHAIIEPEAFNEVLRGNKPLTLGSGETLYNEVVEEVDNWIIIENKLVLKEVKQLVLFCKLPVSHMAELINHQSALNELATLLSKYSDAHVYINRNRHKSVNNRLHFHIVLSEFSEKEFEMYQKGYNEGLRDL